LNHLNRNCGIFHITQDQKGPYLGGILFSRCPVAFWCRTLENSLGKSILLLVDHLVEKKPFLKLIK